MLKYLQVFIPVPIPAVKDGCGQMTRCICDLRMVIGKTEWVGQNKELNILAMSYTGYNL